MGADPSIISLQFRPTFSQHYFEYGNGNVSLLKTQVIVSTVAWLLSASKCLYSVPRYCKRRYFRVPEFSRNLENRQFRVNLDSRFHHH